MAKRLNAWLDATALLLTVTTCEGSFIAIAGSRGSVVIEIVAPAPSTSLSGVPRTANTVYLYFVAASTV